MIKSGSAVGRLFIKLFYEFFFYYESNKIPLKEIYALIVLDYCSPVGFLKGKTHWEKFLIIHSSEIVSKLSCLESKY